MNYKKLVFAFIIMVSIFRLFYINLFPLTGDEAYYWQWSRHLDFGYYEQGPILALIIYIFTLFNKINTIFTVRLGGVIISFLTMIISVLIYRKLYKDSDFKESFFLILFFNSSIIYSTGSVLMMHDTVMILFFAIYLYIWLFIFENPHSIKLWILSALILALGVMSKYTLLTIYLATILFIIITKKIPNFKKEFFIFNILFFLFLFPVIYWNITHDFATFHYLLIRKGNNSHFTLKYLVELISSQIGLISITFFPFLFIIFLKKIKKIDFSPEFFLSFLFLTSFLPFVILSLKNRVEANWPAFCFFPLFFLGTHFIFSIRLKKLLFHFVYGFGLFIVILLHIQIVNPVLPLPPKMNPLKKYYGYKELAIKLEKIIKNYKNDKFFFAARHYQVASLLSFYMKNNPEFYILIKHESNKNYRFWKKYKNFIGYNCFFVYNNEWEHIEMSKFFIKSNIIKKIIVNKNTKYLKTFFVDYNIYYKGL